MSSISKFLIGLLRLFVLLFQVALGFAGGAGVIFGANLVYFASGYVLGEPNHIIAWAYIVCILAIAVYCYRVIRSEEEKRSAKKEFFTDTFFSASGFAIGVVFGVHTQLLHFYLNSIDGEVILMYTLDVLARGIAFDVVESLDLSVPHSDMIEKTGPMKLIELIVRIMYNFVAVFVISAMFLITIGKKKYIRTNLRYPSKEQLEALEVD